MPETERTLGAFVLALTEKAMVLFCFECELSLRLSSQLCESSVIALKLYFNFST